MKKFVAVYLGSENGEKKWEGLDGRTRQQKEREGIQAWQNWVKKNEKSILDVGTPLGTTKRVDPKGISNTTNLLTAYTVVQANSHEEAARLFIDHPHFKVFPGDSIEIMECLSIPGM